MMLLCFGPLAFGAVEGWSIYVLQVGAVTLFALWGVAQIRNKMLHFPNNRLLPYMVLFGMLVGVQVISGATAYWMATYIEFLKYIAYGSIALVASDLFERERWSLSLLWGMYTFGFALSIFAIIQSFTSPNRLYWSIEPAHGGWVFGPYVNHNHYAGLIDLIIPTGIVGTLEAETALGKRLLLAFATTVMIASVILSGSRGGIVSLGIASVMLLALQSHSRNHRFLWLLTPFIIALLWWISADQLYSRVAETAGEFQANSANGRLEALHDGLRMFSNRPWLRWGAGTFPVVFPSFRTFYIDRFFNEAHNDYLQVLIENGIAGFVVMTGFVGTLLVSGVRHRHRIGQSQQAACLAAFAGCVTFLLHSFVDFNLHIPANALLFFVYASLVSTVPQPFGLEIASRKDSRAPAR